MPEHNNSAPADLQALYHATRETLRQADIENTALDARLLICHVLQLAPIDLVADYQRPVSAAEISALGAAVARRLGGEPVSRICGSREFWSLNFIITPDVLDPRPDSETIIMAALERFTGRSPPRTILDLGTGSGCLIVSLLREFSAARGLGLDLSPEALAVARQNALAHDVADRLDLVAGNWGEALNAKFDLIVSNPPYIPQPEIESLAPEVRNHDPILALSGGDDGFFAYKIIVVQLKNLLAPGGTALLETGHDQGENVARLAMNAGLSVKESHRDLAGIPRVVEISTGEN